VGRLVCARLRNDDRDFWMFTGRGASKAVERSIFTFLFSHSAHLLWVL